MDLLRISLGPALYPLYACSMFGSCLVNIKSGIRYYISIGYSNESLRMTFFNDGEANDLFNDYFNDPFSTFSNTISIYSHCLLQFIS